MKALLTLAAALAAFTSALAQGAPASAPAASCPQVAEQLSELLASAKQRVGRDGEVRLAFEVDAQGRARPVAIQGERQYLTPVRIAVDGLECQAGEPRRYVLNIRFQDASPATTPAYFAKR